MSILLIALVIGVFTGLNGVKAGWMGAVAAGVGLLVKSALTLTWVYWMAGFTLIGVMIAAIASVVLKNKAITELITGIQKVKDDSVTVRGTVNAYLQNEQSKDTQKIVQYKKAALKLKGKI